MNQSCYLNAPISLHDAVYKKSLELWLNNRFLHHDNVPVHDALTICFFLNK